MKESLVEGENEIELNLEDLELNDISIVALSHEDAKGVPEMGASVAWVGCCSCCSTSSNCSFILRR